MDWVPVATWYELHVGDRVASVYPNIDHEKPWTGECHCGGRGIQRPHFKTQEEAQTWCEAAIARPTAYWRDPEAR